MVGKSVSKVGRAELNAGVDSHQEIRTKNVYSQLPRRELSTKGIVRRKSRHFRLLCLLEKH